MEDDAYPTPAWCVHRLLEELHTRVPRGIWHEVTAGSGNIIRAVNAWFGPENSITWHATELHENTSLVECFPPSPSTPIPANVHFNDYLTGPSIRCDVAITNPPFSIAEDVIKKALTEAEWVVMLLRMNFLGSDGRANWLRNEMPDIDTLPDRPNFIASYKCKARDKHDRGCGWSTKLPIAAPPIRECPGCGRKVQRSTSDSAEYGWMIWSPERGRSAGVTRILASTPEAERKPEAERQAA
jgi:hypothetical protein